MEEYTVTDIKNKIHKIIIETLSNYASRKTYPKTYFKTSIQKNHFKDFKTHLYQEFEKENNNQNDLIYQLQFYKIDNNCYRFNVIVLKEFEIFTKFGPIVDIITMNKQPFNYNSTKNITLTELLKNSPHENELAYFVNELAEYEAECTLNEDWLNFEEIYLKDEIEYYKSLSDSQRIIYAKAHGYTYAKGFLNKHLKELFTCYDIDFINTLFKNIEFR